MTNEGFRVTCVDLRTGETDTKVISTGDYLLVTADPCRLMHAQHRDSGAVTLSLEGHQPVRLVQTIAPEQVPHQARRGSDVEAWLRQWRDEFDRYGMADGDLRWGAIDDMLDDYRLRADLGAPLSETVTEG